MRLRVGRNWLQPADGVGEAWRGTRGGVSVSNACLAPAKYAFTLSGDKTTLSGSDTLYNVPMTLTLSADGACFVGHWVSEDLDFVATIWNFAAH